MVIGTPGRINDILSKHEEVFRLEQIKMVVFDEVDVMLHMGFQNQVIFSFFALIWRLFPLNASIVWMLV